MLFFIACRAQKKQDSSCGQNLKKSQTLISRYFINKDSKTLDSATLLVELSLGCNGLNRQLAVKKRIDIFLITKNAKDGAAFIEQTSESDFSFSYKKTLYKNYFTYLDSTTDTNAQKVKLLRTVAEVISKAINDKKNKGEDIHSEYFTDWVLVRKLFQDTVSLSNDIDSLAKQHPKHADLLQFLKEAPAGLGNEEVIVAEKAASIKEEQ
jgi:hypothetical protein